MFVPSVNIENPIDDLSPAQITFLAERQTTSIPNDQRDDLNNARTSERANNNQNLASELNLNDNPTERFNYADIDRNLKYNKEDENFVTGQRSGISDAKNYPLYERNTNSKEILNYADFIRNLKYNEDNENFVPEQRSGKTFSQNYPFYKRKTDTNPKERLGYADFNRNLKYNEEDANFDPEQRSGKSFSQNYPSYQEMTDTNPNERLSYIVDRKPDYKHENNNFLPEQRSETGRQTPQNNRPYFARQRTHYNRPKPRGRKGHRNDYDNRADIGSLDSIRAQLGYIPVKPDDRYDHDSLNFQEGDDDHSAEFVDFSRHSDLYDIRNGEDHPDEFDVLSGSEKYVNIIII